VYNAEKDVTSSGGTAEDVLKKVPMVSVDLDGNVSIRGSSNIKVLINNKPSSIVAGSIADAIKQIPSDQIKSVEVITSPSAKYDAEGTGGIINIITKKNTLQGITGSVNLGAGTRGSNLFGSLNLKTKKLAISINGGGNAGYNIPTDGYSENKRFLPNNVISGVNQTNAGSNTRFFGNGQLSIDYDMNAKNNITISGRMNAGNFDIDQDLTSSISRNDVVLQSYKRSIVQNNHRNNYDVEMNYTHKFDRKDEELTFLGQYSRQNTPSNYSLSQFTPNNELFYKENNDNKGSNNETTLQLDYSLPKDKSTFEVGAKAIIRRLTSDYVLNYDSVSITKNPDIFTNSPLRSNTYAYDQNVVAAYSTYSIQLPQKWTLKAGVRYEYTTVQGDFKKGTDATALSFRPEPYGFFAPSFSIAKDLPKNQKLKLNYSYRIQRPSLNVLNPYVNQSDNTNISYGNTQLTKEHSNSVELSYSKFFKANSIFFTTFYRQTLDNISSYSFIDNKNRQVTTNVNNNNDNNYYGANLFINLQISKKIRVGTGGDFTHSELLVPTKVSVPVLQTDGTFVYQTPENASKLLGNSGWTYRINGNVQWTIATGINAQLFGFYSGPDVRLQGTQGGFYFYNLGIKKDFKNKKGSFGLAFDNPFTPIATFKTDLSDATFTNYAVRNMHTQGVRFTLSYNFGKMSFDDSGLFRRKKSVNNDDTKTDGGSDQQGATQQGGGRPR
jgi:ferric enterobactin receptor